VSRRPLGSGCVKRHSGRDSWLAVITLADGRRKSRTRPTREAAEEAVADLIAEYAGQLGYMYSYPRPWRFGRRESPRHGISPGKRWLVLERDGFRCVYCGATAAHARLVIDHRVPVAAGGTDDIDNLATACEPCNLGKGSQPDPTGRWT
jgi:hypothetical protein